MSRSLFLVIILLGSPSFACEDEIYLRSLGLTIQKATSTLTDAEVILIGERHYDRSRAYREIIETFAQRGNAVFLEAIERGVRIDPGSDERTAGLTVPVTVGGWDHAELVAALQPAMVLLASFFLWVPDTVFLDGERAASMHLAHRLALRIEALCRQRDNDLNATVMRHVPVARLRRERTFLVAGSNHLTENAGLVDALANARYVIAIPVGGPERDSGRAAIEYYRGQPEPAPSGSEIIRRFRAMIEGLARF